MPRTRAKHWYCGLVQQGERVFPTDIRNVFTALRTGGGPGRYVNLPHCVISSDRYGSEDELESSIRTILKNKNLRSDEPLELAVEYLDEAGYRTRPVQEGVLQEYAVIPRRIFDEVNRLTGEPI